ncbi:MAG TPA: fimbria/pilus outer membrane usher protein [Steroidobacteraceae bacterium]|nr:fimbria/pilus outer membrane usher protein [Steroidobacteraceae bacterium]
MQLNGQAPETVLMRRDPDGQLWARVEDLKRWRLRLPAAAPVIQDGNEFQSLASFPGLKWQIDEATQSVTITAPARLFERTQLGFPGLRAARPDPAAPGGFLNYDLLATHGPAGSPSSLGATLEAGMFNRWGEGTSTFARINPSDGSRFIRLDTAWTQDRPDTLSSLLLGDSISQAGSWGGAVRFAGVQWHTDFTTQPGFVTTPLAGLKGEATLPSTVDLYVNNALRLQSSVPPGPFSIPNIPLVSGLGDVQLVVRDVLGREQLISVPYYSSPSLLREGLSSYSYEMGATRNNYGLTSNDYGPGLMAGTHRYGFNDSFTGETHVELQYDQQNAGIGGVWLQRGVGVLNAGVSASHSSGGDGGLMQVGFERQAPGFSVSGTARFETAQYRQLGILPTQLAPVRELQLNLSTPIVHRTALNLSYIQQDYRDDRPPEHLLSMNTNHSFGGVFWSLYGFKPLRGPGSTTVGLSLNIPFGPRSNFTATTTHDDSGTHEQLEVQQNLPLGRGYGYRIIAAPDSTNPIGASGSYQNDVGTYTVSASKFEDGVAESAEDQGGIAFLGGHAYLSRRLDDSFAVVQVGDYPDVRVYADNQEAGRTDSNGTVLIPRLRPYEENPVSIEQADLPLDADIPTIEQLAVPYRRSGLKLDFAVKQSYGALVVLQLDNGSPVPSGAVVHLIGGDIDFPVALRGESYVTGLSEHSRLAVSWAGGGCEIAVHFAPSADPLPRLGPYLCKGPATAGN